MLYILVVGIKHSRYSFGALLICNGAFVLSGVELLEIKLSTRSFATPESEIVASWGLVSRDCIV
jgi:hypothetical protein